ncbi:MAG: DNA polymerase IV [Cyclobacteriaceae bacterium]
MDAFFASVEQRDNPALRGKPIAVGGSKERGVVAAASYEARKYGVKSAMPSSIAARKCPELIFVPHHFDKYHQVSKEIRSIFHEYTDLIEPLSLDEAYLDVTENKLGLNSATLIAKEIKEKIEERTKLTASAGISYCKFLAKTASDINKPDGLFVILPQEAESFLSKMRIAQFHGIGKATAEKMKQAGIFQGSDLRKKSLEDLTLRFGKMGSYYYNICRGIDNRPVIPDRERKSISSETTFSTNLMKLTDVHAECKKLIGITYKRYIKTGSNGKTIHLKIKYGDFRQITRSRTIAEFIQTKEELTTNILRMADESILNEAGIRLVGVGLSNFGTENPEPKIKQLTIQF